MFRFPLLLLLPVLIVLSGCAARELRTRNTMLEQRLLQVQQDLEASESQLRALQERLEEKDQAVSGLENELAALREREAATRRVMTESQQNQAEALVKDMEERLARENELRLQLDDALAAAEAAENDQVLLEEQLAELRTEMDGLLTRLEEATATIARQRENFETAIAERDSARAERDDFRRQLQAARADATGAAEQMEQVSNRLRDTEKELAAAKRALEEADAAAKAATEEAAAKAASAAAMIEAVKSAVSGDDDITVREENNELHLVVQSDDLYQPGTVLLSDEGIENLEVIAGALSGRDFSALRVEGHTDNTPVRNMPFVDNWDLAAARAATVTRWLASRSEIPARRITASSHAWFDPLESNDTATGRRANRRVEVVVVP
jgi:chemotaxis protein MotB